MRILALDTSTGPASIALVEGDVAVAIHEDNESMQQSKRLVADADRLVRAHGGYESLDAIAVTIGPGGFTGIRVALAAARGLALACGVPLIGISSLETFAWQALHSQPENTIALAYINAFRNQAYVQPFVRRGHLMAPLSDAVAVDIADIATCATPYPNALLLGNIELPIAGYAHFASPHARYAAAYTALLSLHQPDTIALRPAEAFYIRPPDAKPQKPLLGA